MHDPRFDKLAQLLVEYSTRLKRKETVLIESFDIPDEMTIALVRAVRKAGAIPFTQIQRGRVTRELALNASERQLNLIAIHELARMKRMDAYIGLRGSNNISELNLRRQVLGRSHGSLHARRRRRQQEGNRVCPGKPEQR